MEVKMMIQLSNRWLTHALLRAMMVLSIVGQAQGQQTDNQFLEQGAARVLRALDDGGT
jgi:hypothetical protein